MCYSLKSIFMAQNSAPKTLLKDDLVISRPVLDLPEGYEYPVSQQGRARDLADIFENPPKEIIMAAVRGNEDFGSFMSYVVSMGDIYPDNLTQTIVQALGLARAGEELLFPGTKLKVTSDNFGHLVLGSPQEGDITGLDLPKHIIGAMMQSSLPSPASQAAFLRVSGRVKEGVLPPMAPAVLVGPITCRVVTTEEEFFGSPPNPILT